MLKLWNSFIIQNTFLWWYLLSFYYDFTYKGKIITLIGNIIIHLDKHFSKISTFKFYLARRFVLSSLTLTAIAPSFLPDILISHDTCAHHTTTFRVSTQSGFLMKKIKKVDGISFILLIAFIGLPIPYFRSYSKEDF